MALFCLDDPVPTVPTRSRPLFSGTSRSRTQGPPTAFEPALTDWRAAGPEPDTPPGRGRDKHVLTSQLSRLRFLAPSPSVAR